jgi:GNAT superfamily N-acetyltransferase
MNTYWEGCFPNRSRTCLDVEEAILLGADSFDDDDHIGRARSNKSGSVCYVAIDRVGLRDTKESVVRKKLEVLLHSSPEESWNPRTFNYVGFIWPTSRPIGHPVGFFVFNVQIERTARRQISYVGFTYELVFVRKDYRGRGLGRFASAGVARWLHQCRVHSPYVASRGVRLHYMADIKSPEGLGCSSIVLGTLQGFWDDSRTGISQKGLEWHIREFNIEVG